MKIKSLGDDLYLVENVDYKSRKSEKYIVFVEIIRGDIIINTEVRKFHVGIFYNEFISKDNIRNGRFVESVESFSTRNNHVYSYNNVSSEYNIKIAQAVADFIAEQETKRPRQSLQEKRPDASFDIQEIINNLKESDIDFMLKKLFGMREDLKEVLKDSDDLRIKISNAIVAATEVAFILSSYTKEGSYMDKLMEVIKERKS